MPGAPSPLALSPSHLTDGDVEPVAALFKGRAQVATPVLIDGSVGIRIAPAGRLILVLRPTIVDGRIVDVEAVANPATLAGLPG